MLLGVVLARPELKLLRIALLVCFGQAPGPELKLLRIAFLVCFGQAPGPELKWLRVALLGAVPLKFPARNVFS